MFPSAPHSLLPQVNIAPLETPNNSSLNQLQVCSEVFWSLTSCVIENSHKLIINYSKSTLAAGKKKKTHFLLKDYQLKCTWSLFTTSTRHTSRLPARTVSMTLPSLLHWVMGMDDMRSRPVRPTNSQASCPHRYKDSGEIFSNAYSTMSTATVHQANRRQMTRDVNHHLLFFQSLKIKAEDWLLD